MRQVTTILLLACVASGCSGDDEVIPEAAPRADAAAPVADAPPGAGDGLPQHAVGFFRAGACPAGWAPYADGAYRVLLPSPTGVGTTRGAPLVTGEERTHPHAGAVAATVPEVSYVGAPGGGNAGVGAAGTRVATAAVQPAPAGLPYVQLLVCRKIDAPPPGAPAPPSGLLVFVDAPACPAGFTAADAERRFWVGLPEGAAAGATFGGAPLDDGEVRAHEHTLAGQLATSSHGIALASGCCAGGYAQNGAHEILGAVAASEATPPYLQLRACRAD
jgi:hypothetical protein